MKPILFSTLLMTLLALTGCQNPPISGKAETEVYPKISVNDGELARALRFEPTIVTTTPVGNLQLTQPMRSASNEVLFIEWRVDWFDRNGQIIRPEMTWQRLRLEPRMQIRTNAQSTSPEAVDYQIYIRWSRP
jgi:uncharacterized protein YcfL